MNTRPTVATRGDIWFIDLGTPIGHEMGGRRPALVVSADLLNHGPSGLCIVLLITTRFKAIPSHVLISPPEGGAREPSYIKCEDARSISNTRLTERWGAVSDQTMDQVSRILRLILDL